MKLGLIALAAWLSAISARAADLPEPRPTARDMYVSCYLLANGTDVFEKSNGKHEKFSASWCGGRALAEIANHEGREVKSKYKFCLDDGAATRANLPKAMAFAYLDFFERPDLKDRNIDGRAAYLFAMVARWPCPS